MRINRLELIQKIEHLIVQREESALQRKTEAYDKAGRAETEYVRDHARDWGKFADTIRLRNRRSQVVTIDDVPESLRQGRQWGRSVQLFEPHRVRDSDYVPQTQVLTNLRAVLQASPDEFVTTSTLDRMGAPLRELMRP